MLNRSKQSGVTLVEMMVAVTIMVVVFVISGMVFKATSTASGKASASIAMFQDIRALSSLLEKELTGLMTDMPMAVAFEKTMGGGGVDVYRDRLVFFSQGGFQSIDGLAQGNIARIFYGQSSFTSDSPNPDTDHLVQYLTRRCKIIKSGIPVTQNIGSAKYNVGPDRCTTTFWQAANQHTPEEYDKMYMELPIVWNNNNSSGDFLLDPINYWKNCAAFYNKTTVPATYGYEYYLSETLNPAAVGSIIRRPNLATIYNNGIEINPTALQALLLLKDMRSFQVQFWFDGAVEWFPNDVDVALIDDATSLCRSAAAPWGRAPAPQTWQAWQFGFVWNINDDFNYGVADTNFTRMTVRGLDVTNTSRETDVNWRTEPSLDQIRAIMPNWRWQNSWPAAVRITLSLHDETRRFYPEGKPISFVIKLPERR